MPTVGGGFGRKMARTGGADGGGWRLRILRAALSKADSSEVRAKRKPLHF